jgi:hypothetical protein
MYGGLACISHKPAVRRENAAQGAVFHRVSGSLRFWNGDY